MVIAYIQNSYEYIILLGFITFNYGWLLRIMFSINKFKKNTIYYLFIYFFLFAELKKKNLLYIHICVTCIEIRDRHIWNNS